MSAAAAKGAEGEISLSPPVYVVVASVRTQERIAVTAPAGLSWTASARAPWMTIGSGATGEGSGSVAVDVEENKGALRGGVVTIGDRSVALLQEAAPAWIHELTMKAPMPIIEKTGLDGFIEEIRKLPPEARPAALVVLVASIGALYAPAEALYAGSGAVPHEYPQELLAHELALAEEYAMKQVLKG